MTALERYDPEVAAAIRREEERLWMTLELIASENYTSPAVLEAMGSVLTNKYAEGLPRARYYGGCQHVDTVEELARERAKALFGADHANVQAHSGAQANMATYFALMQVGDVAMGMSLSHGGHMTHGLSVSFSGHLYKFVPYGVHPETERLDYDEMARIARECKPKVIVVGASAYARIIDFPRCREIADEVGACVVVDMAHIAGLIAAGLHPSPIPYAQVVTSTTHKTLRGPRSGFILCQADLAQKIDRAVFPYSQGGPHMHTIAAKAVCFHEAMQPEFRSYQERVVENARTLAEELVRLGFRVVSGGTDTHLLLLDVGVKGLTGKEAERALEEVGITVNKNTIPFDPRPPAVTSGIRLGTPALTTRGLGPDEMRRIARLIAARLDALTDEEVARRVGADVEEICRSFPVPGIPALPLIPDPPRR